MKVLVFNSSLRIGGAESMSIELANALADAGAEVSFASADGPLRENIDPRVPWLRTSNPNRVPLAAAGQLAGYLRALRPDVVHSHGGICCVVASMAAATVRPAPVRVLTHHSRIFRRAPDAISSWFMRRCADHYVAISTDKRASLEAIGVAPERITLIPNFVDVERVTERVRTADRPGIRRALGIPDNALVAVIAGRVLPAKGFDRFVRILSRVAAAVAPRPVHGVAVGDGPALADVRRVALEEAAPSVIHFTGYERDVFPHLAIADAALFPTRHPEVLPMFLIECAAAGLPAVCSDIPGNRDIVVAGETGLLVDGSDDEWAVRLTGLLDDVEGRTRMARAAREVARERFDVRRVAADTLGLYRRLASI